MTCKEFIKKIENLSYIFDVSKNIATVHDDKYWRNEYGIDSVLVSIFWGMVASIHSNTLKPFCTKSCAIFLAKTYKNNAFNNNQNIFDYLYKTALKIFENKYKRIGVLTLTKFIEKLYELPKIYNLEEPFDESHYLKDGELILNKRYHINFGLMPEQCRQVILKYEKEHYVSYDDWDFIGLNNFYLIDKYVSKEEREQRGPQNCYDLAYEAITKFFDDEGRRKK